MPAPRPRSRSKNVISGTPDSVLGFRQKAFRYCNLQTCSYQERGLVQSEVAPRTVDARTCHSATHRLLDFIGARDGSLGRCALVSNGGTGYYERKQDCHRVSARRESCFLKGVLLSVVVTWNHHCLNQAPNDLAWHFSWRGTSYRIARGFPGEPVAPLSRSGANTNANSLARSWVSSLRSRFSSR